MQMIFIPVKQENYFLRIYCWIPVREGMAFQMEFPKKRGRKYQRKSVSMEME